MTRVHYEHQDGLARLTLDSPRAGNPLTLAALEELFVNVRRANADGARVLLLAAQGARFCVGGDVAEFGSARNPEAQVDDMAERLHRTISELHNLDAIVVSKVQGTAAGAGVLLAGAADILLAGHSARFLLAYTAIGLSPDGGTSLLSSSLGLHRSLAMALLNPVLTADQAHASGLVAQVHPDGELDRATEAVLQGLLRGSRTAQVATKRLLRQTAQPAAETALRRETMSIRRCAAAPDGREGITAFNEKRAPVFPSTVA